MIGQPRVARAGVTLRHWTTDRLSFVGGRERPSSGSSFAELADGRLLNLVASKLSLLQATADRQNQVLGGSRP
jgi:hypothetical protein